MINLPFVLCLSLVFIVVWAIVSYSFIRINQKTKLDRKFKVIQPALRLADQWLMESQRKIEGLIESAEQPLGTAQSELLELRLEASRLPQGVKNLQNVREALEHPMKLKALGQPLVGIVGLYLSSTYAHVEDDGFVYLDTDAGSLPVLEAPATQELNDGVMKGYLQRLSAKANSSMGGFLYFAKPEHFAACQSNPEWMEALRNYRLVVLDHEGLAALLISLKLSHETDRLIQVFQAGVQSTVPLVGQSDKMGLALTALGASVLGAQNVLEGGIPTAPVEKMEDKP